MYESKLISVYDLSMFFLFNLKPKGLVGFGAITDTVFFFDNSCAKSSESLAETTGSGEKTAVTISIFNLKLFEKQNAYF